MTCVALAHLGHQVVGTDADREKISLLQRGVAPFYEPGLDDLLSEGFAARAIRFGSDIADLVRKLSGSASEIVHVERPVDDPTVRCPDISLARSALGWEPKVPLEEGLAATIDWAKQAGWKREDRPSADRVEH